jgi:hypothetical protein
MGIQQAMEAQGAQARGVLKAVPVPQWETDEGIPNVYFYEGLSVDEWVAVGRHFNGGDIDPEGILTAVRWLFRNEDGVRMFYGEAAFGKLREKADIRVLLDVLNRSEIFRQFADDPVAAAKKT